MHHDQGEVIENMTKMQNSSLVKSKHIESNGNHKLPQVNPRQQNGSGLNIKLTRVRSASLHREKETTSTKHNGSTTKANSIHQKSSQFQDQRRSSIVMNQEKRSQGEKKTKIPIVRGASQGDMTEQEVQKQRRRAEIYEINARMRAYHQERMTQQMQQMTVHAPLGV